MKNITDGGPAFPFNDADECGRGMSLRDYFAAKALARYSPDYIGKMHDAYEQIAENCYAIADAMLKARAHPEPQSPRAAQDAHLRTK